MPKYLITATAYRRAEASESYSPRTYTFEVNLDAPWSGKNGALPDVAFHECHRIYGFWPKQAPQIDSVVEVSEPYRDALKAIHDLVCGAEQNDVWDHLNIADFAALIPDSAITPAEPTAVDWSETEKLKGPALPVADEDDADSLI